MKVLIKETKEAKELTYMYNNVNCALDLLEPISDDEFDFDDDAQMWTCSNEKYNIAQQYLDILV